MIHCSEISERHELTNVKDKADIISEQRDKDAGGKSLVMDEMEYTGFLNLMRSKDRLSGSCYQTCMARLS